jgi:hypothetical protein
MNDLFQPWRTGPGGVRLRCAVVRVGPASLEPTHLLGPDDEGILIVEVGPVPDTQREALLWVVLSRGETVRDVFRQPLRQCPATGGSFWFRLNWTQTAQRSSRLRIAVLLDEQEVERLELLLTLPTVDGQGRFRASVQQTSPSSATVLAFVEALARETGTNGKAGRENPGGPQA